MLSRCADTTRTRHGAPLEVDARYRRGDGDAALAFERQLDRR